jgi:hypothetical protein
MCFICSRNHRLPEAVAMKSEIAMLQCVWEVTRIPVPRVFGYSLNHDIGVSSLCVLME